MSEIPQYVQCYMKRADQDRGALMTTAWIEARGAKEGAVVELITLEGKELWQVVRAYGNVSIPQDVLKETQRQRRKAPPSIRDTKKDKRQQEASS